jgi:AraC-like DNA-binding protein
MDVHLSASEPVERALITGAWWIFTQVLVEQGAIEAVTDHRRLLLPASFALLVPPYSLVRLVIRGSLHCPGLAGTAPLPASLGLLPLFTPTDAGIPLPLDLSDLAGRLQDGQTLDPDGHAAPYVATARRTLADERGSRQPVARAAAAAGVHPATLTRAFGTAYGISPKAYVHRLRVADAVFHLLAGQPILQTAADVGFGEASRFYEQFARITRNTPGQYAHLSQTLTSENGKRPPGNAS